MFQAFLSESSYRNPLGPLRFQVPRARVQLPDVTLAAINDGIGYMKVPRAVLRASKLARRRAAIEDEGGKRSETASATDKSERRKSVKSEMDRAGLGRRKPTG